MTKASIPTENPKTPSDNKNAIKIQLHNDYEPTSDGQLV